MEDVKGIFGLWLQKRDQLPTKPPPGQETWAERHQRLRERVCLQRAKETSPGTASASKAKPFNCN